MVEARSTSITTATPPRSPASGIKPGRRCTNTIAAPTRRPGRRAESRALGSVLFPWPTRNAFLTIDYGIASRILGDPAVDSIVPNGPNSSLVSLAPGVDGNQPDAPARVAARACGVWANPRWRQSSCAGSNGGSLRAVPTFHVLLSALLCFFLLRRCRPFSRRSPSPAAAAVGTAAADL